MSRQTGWLLGLAVLLGGCADNAAQTKRPQAGDKSSKDAAKTAGTAVVNTAVVNTAAETAPDKTPASVKDQFGKAMRLADLGELSRAMTMIESLLAREDLENDTRRYFLIVATQMGMALGQQHAEGMKVKESHVAFLKAAAQYRTLKETYKTLKPPELGFGGSVFYQEACIHSLQKDTKAALASLTLAFEHGLADFERVAEDEDLANLRKLPTFAKYISGHKLAVAKRRKENVRKELADNKTFPLSFTLPDLDGNRISLDTYKGKVVIVDIWGTWCPPCREEIPHLARLQKTYGEQGFQIIGVNYERGANPVPLIKAAIKELGINYPCVMGDQATANKIPDFGTFPMTLFIDRSGTIRLKAEGLRPFDYLEEVVKTLLAEPAPKLVGTTGKKKPAKDKPADKKTPAKDKPAKKTPAAQKSPNKKP